MDLVQNAYERDGDLRWSLNEFRHILERTEHTQGLSIQGDAAANGTKVLSVTVSAGEVLFIQNLFISGDLGVKIVQSSSAAVGGTETHLCMYDPTGEFPNPHLAMKVDNRGGTTDTYLLIYIPKSHNGNAAYNAAGKYVSVDLWYIKDHASDANT